MNELERALAAGPPADRAPLPDVSVAAQAAGLLDLAYATVDSPVGRLLLVASPTGLVRLAFLAAQGPDAELELLAGRLSPRILHAPARLQAPARELDEYFSGTRSEFELELDRRLMTPFAQRVLQVTAAIPYGQTSTYAAVAATIGAPRAARAAGGALGANPLPIVVPCHRVLTSAGGLGGYIGGVDHKRALLTLEGALPPNRRY